MSIVRSAGATFLAAAICFSVGCGRDGLPNSYGHRSGAVSTKSVNGLSVISDMFESEGWETTSWRRLSPKLNEAETIVWVPNSFVAPDEEQVDWLQRWLDEGYGRTLVYVGRGYDAAPEYWQRVTPTAPAEDEAWMKEEQQQAEFEFRSDLKALDDSSECRWYRMSPRKTSKQVAAFSEDSTWADGVDAANTNIPLHTKLLPPSDLDPAVQLEVLLSSDNGDVIAYKLSDGPNQVIVIVNGSFLLNLALVNKEHRKLAGRLIEECGSTRGPGRAVFLEETPLRLEIYDQEPANEQRSGFTMLTIWPLGFLLLHMLLLGVVICFVAFPIFGRPKYLKNLGVSDFGKHIQALGALIAATENRSYALERLKHYDEHVRRESRDT